VSVTPAIFKPGSMVLKPKKKQKHGFPIEDFGNDATDNEGALPPHNPRKRRKHKKINTTRRKTPPRCHS